MEGLKTLILAGVGFLFATLSGMGIIVPEDEQTAIAIGIYSVLVIVVRHFTEGKVWYKQ